MFCPFCGTESTQGLNYCKRCGANLGAVLQGGAQDVRPAVSNGMAWAAGLSTTLVVVLGIGIIFLIMSDLAARHVHPTAMVFIALSMALAVVGCVALLLHFWSSLLGAGRPATRAALQTPPAASTGELGATRFEALNPQPVPSVTEHTTRTLDHVKR